MWNAFRKNLPPIEQTETTVLTNTLHQISNSESPPTMAATTPRKLRILQPTAFKALKPIVDELIKHHLILIDLSKLTAEDRLRTIDFLSGVMYGLDGEYTKIESKIYRFTVKN